MACDGRSVDQAQRPFLDDRSRTDAIAHELHDEQPDPVVKLWELKGLPVSDVTSKFVGKLLGYLSIQAVQINTRVKWL